MPELRLYTAGSNSHGQLGIGHEEDAHTFTSCNLAIEVSDAQTIHVKICAGANHTLLLVEQDGIRELFGAGSSKRGQLGRAEEENRLSFVPLSLSTILECIQDDDAGLEDKNWRLKDVAAGWETSFFLLENAKHPAETLLLAAGSDDFGQLGVKNTANVSVLNRIHLPAGTSASQIHSGPRHTIAVMEDGTTFGWGASRHGQLGDASEQAIAHVPVEIAVIRYTASKGQNSVALGHQHTLLISNVPNKPIQALGNNKKGQLGTLDVKARSAHPALSGHVLSEDDIARDLQVFANWNSSFVLDKDANTLYSFGNNASGQLGRDSKEPGDVGTVDFEVEDTRMVIKQVATGSEHALAILETDGQMAVWGWGWNEHGNLGLDEGKLEDVKKPVHIGIPGEGAIHSVHAGNGTSWVAVLER